jgi:hypothetical protein
MIESGRSTEGASDAPYIPPAEGMTPTAGAHTFGAAQAEITAPGTVPEGTEPSASPEAPFPIPGTVSETAVEGNEAGASDVPVAIKPAPPARYYVRERDELRPINESTNQFEQEIVAHLHGQRQEARDKLLKVTSPDHSGFNTQRIAAFATRQGLQRTGEFVTYDSTRPDVAARVDEIVGEQPIAYAAIYEPESGLYIVKQRPELDAVNGEGFTESNVVHETVGHGSAEEPTYSVEIVSNGSDEHILQTTLERRGFQHEQKNEGFLLEEGFSEAVRARYMREELGLEGGFLRAKNPVSVLERDGVAYPMQTIYSFKTQEGKIGYHTNALAGMVVNMLVERDPALWDAMVQSRNDYEGNVEEVVGRIDAIAPGLYSRLARLNHTQFANGLAMTAALLGKG